MIGKKYYAGDNRQLKTLNIIAKTVAKEARQEPEFLFSDRRTKDVVELRSIFHFFARKYTHFSSTYIGEYSKYMGRKKAHDHASVLHSVNNIQDWISVDKKFKTRMQILDNEVKMLVDYENFCFDKSNDYKKEIVSLIYHTQDLEYLKRMDELTKLLYMDRSSDHLDHLINQTKVKLENNERIHQVTQSDNGLGMVQGSGDKIRIHTPTA